MLTDAVRRKVQAKQVAEQAQHPLLDVIAAAAIDLAFRFAFEFLDRRECPVGFEHVLRLPAGSSHQAPLFCASNPSELPRQAGLRERKGFRQMRVKYR
jgi:hypothetical protein